MSSSPTKTPAEIRYPESDGKPMGETATHVHTTFDIYETLKELIFRDTPDLCVAADLFFYFEEGNPKAVKAPDVLFAKGVRGGHDRRTYKLWVEDVVPCVIFEVTSKETRRDDTVTKVELYARLGVLEYFLFDPLGEYLNPPLRGFRLGGDRYAPILPDAEGVFESLHLGLKLRAEGTTVRFIDPRTNEPIPSIFELPELAENRRRANQALERGLADYRGQLEREKKKSARESKKAEAERRKAEAWKAEVERLRALLREQGVDDPVGPDS